MTKPRTTEPRRKIKHLKRVERTERRQPSSSRRDVDQKFLQRHMARFVAWDKADTITGATITGMVITLLYLVLGGVSFGDAFKLVSPTLPYLFLLLTVYYCMDKAMCLMKRRTTPLLDPEHCADLNVWQMIVIAVTGNLASGGFILISIIITLFVMATLNPEAFRELLVWLESV